MATLTVGRGQQYATVSEAIAASRDGDVLQVQAGTYTNDFATITTDITLQSVGGMAHMKATTPPGNGKAIFVTRGDITIEGFEFSGVAVRDGNGAGIRHEDGNLTIRGSHFHHNQDGILTIARNAEATLTIQDSEFNDNGIGDGRTHNLYVGKIGRLEVDNSYFHSVPVGHLLKSRAEETVITNSRFFDHGSSASYEIDLPNGGDAVLRGNVIQQGPNSQNANIVAFGAEGNLHPGSSIEMTDNVVINQRAAGGTMLWNKAGAPATLVDNEVFGVAEARILSGPGTVTGTEFLAAPPRLDTSSPWEGGGRPTTPPPENPDPPPAQDPEPPSSGPEPSDAARIWGTGGDDLLLGGPGRSQLIGREGNDTLDGGPGDDGLIGGPGADVFRFGADFGNDGIREFEHGADRLDLSALGIAEAEFAVAIDIAQRGANVIITVEDHGTIKVYGADAAQFDSGDFILG